MRELTESETQCVVGGGIIGEFAADGGAIGTVVGYVAETTVMGATRGGLVGAMAGTAFGAGYLIGSYAYDVYSES